MDAAVRTHCLLGVEEMYRADSAAMEAGVSGPELMEAAGGAIARAIVDRWSPRPVAILAGPGNNGGDGFVVARLLDRAGWPVRLSLLGDRDALRGDAAWAADLWTGPVEALTPGGIEGAGLIVDALFGAGLARPVEGVAAAVLRAADAAGVPVVAVDVPSGVHGDSGAVLGFAAQAELTVTFFRKKPGHLLLPGRLFSGDVEVADIGIPTDVLDTVAPRQCANHPDLWRERMRRPTLTDHKYTRGHVLVFGGALMTGAGRLAARAALRAGAGMVTVACPEHKIDAYLADTAALLAIPSPDPGELGALVAARRISGVVAGPGLGTGRETRTLVEAILAAGVPTVLDADALTAFANDPEGFAGHVSGPVILTPHGGEFARLFAEEGDKLARTRAASARSGATIVFKGGDTVVADPTGAAVINDNAPAWLATAGAGDVLSGITGALLAQGFPAFQAACAAVWIHGAAAQAKGPGLIADDLADTIPTVVSSLYEHAE